MKTRNPNARRDRDALVLHIQRLAREQRSFATIVRAVCAGAVDCEGLEPTPSEIWDGLIVVAQHFDGVSAELSERVDALMTVERRNGGAR